MSFPDYIINYPFMHLASITLITECLLCVRHSSYGHMGESDKFTLSKALLAIEI